MPAEIAVIAWQNKAPVYDLLFRSAAETMLTIAADPRHLGARIGITAVLHSWGSAMTHHPHIHMIVPGGGLSRDGQRWIASRAGFLLPVRVLSRLFRRLFLSGLLALHAAGQLGFFGEVQELARSPRLPALSGTTAPQELGGVRQAALRGAGGRIGVSRPLYPPGRHLQPPVLAMDERGVTFHYKDYRRDGAARYRTMTLAPAEFIRRFLLHVLPKGFHRLRHYGLFASASRKANIARIRDLLAVPQPAVQEVPTGEAAPEPWRCCPCCGGPMIILEILARSLQPRAPPAGSQDQPGDGCRDPARPAPRQCPGDRTTGHAASRAEAVIRLVQTGKPHSPHHKSTGIRPGLGQKTRTIEAKPTPRNRHPAPRQRHHLPRKSQIPIAIARGPRVRSSGTFVRLRRPKLSTITGLTASWRAPQRSGRSASSRSDGCALSADALRNVSTYARMLSVIRNLGAQPLLRRPPYQSGLTGTGGDFY